MMMTIRHTDGSGRPWFVRTSGRGRCQLRPASAAGWLLTFLYGSVIGGVSLLFLTGQPGPAEVAAWAVLMAAATFAYLLTAWRTAEKIEPGGDICARTRSGRNQAKASLLVALATAAAIIGAALLGIEF